MKVSYNARWGHPRTRQAHGSARRQRRNEEAIARNMAWAMLSAKEQYEYLWKTFPTGATKQKDRLRLQLHVGLN